MAAAAAGTSSLRFEPAFSLAGAALLLLLLWWWVCGIMMKCAVLTR
jgi:hypothetical protein